VFSNRSSDDPSPLPKPRNGPERNGPERAPLKSAAAPAAQASAAPDTSAPIGTSVIGNDLTLLGENITIISKNKLQVDGHVRGNVHGRQVTISTCGSVTGRVCAEKIEVRGGVRGSIRAVTVALHESAKVDGDIMHQKLSISEGAAFDGRVRLIKNQAELMPVLDAEAVAAGQGMPDDGDLGA
jgi:cytoskeletal protein CcmA (bactofilin family)